MKRRFAIAEAPASIGVSEEQAALLEHYKYSTPVYPITVAVLFDRLDQTGLGVAASGQTWVAATGQINISNQLAVANADGTNVATLQGRADVQVDAHLNYTTRRGAHRMGHCSPCRC